MKDKNLFEKFATDGKLLLPDLDLSFGNVPWSKHPAFEGVELKDIVAACQTNGQCSFHLVRIAPHQKIGNHMHQEQLETHEVIAGSGICVHNGEKLRYEPGVISIFPARILHEVLAGPDGLCLFAKFMTAHPA